MQLRKMSLMLTVLGAVGMMLAGCGGGDTTTTCSADTDCLESEICHPGAKVCVQTCTSGADCPDTAKTCGALSNTDTRNICKCSTTALCNTGRETADLECSTAYQVCVPTGTAAGCTKDTDCASGQTCQAGVCKAPTQGATCSGQGQTTCTYGEYCGGTTCTAAPVAPSTCENFSQNRPQWSATTSNGPVIYTVERNSYQANYQYCDQSGGAPDAFIVRLRAYRTDANWPDQRSGLSGFFYVTTGSNRLDVVNNSLLVPGTGYNRSTSNPKDAEFNVYLCRPTGSQTIQVGFYFTGGNPVCAQINR